MSYFLPESQTPTLQQQAEIRQMFVDDGCIQEFDPPATLKNGELSRVKIDAELLSDQSIERLIGIIASTSVWKAADAVVGMPDGMTGFAGRLHEATAKPLIVLEKDPYEDGGLLYAADKVHNFSEAFRSSHILALDDVTTSGSTFAAARRLLPKESYLSTLSLVMRGSILPEYDHGFTAHHALIETLITSDMTAAEVRAQFTA